MAAPQIRRRVPNVSDGSFPKIATGSQVQRSPGTGGRVLGFADDAIAAGNHLMRMARLKATPIEVAPRPKPEPPLWSAQQQADAH